MRKFHKYLLASAVPLSAVMFAAPAFASGADASASASAPSDGGIADIVVTARKRAESAQSVPVAITAFSPAALQAKQIVNITDIAHNTSGLVLQQSSSTQQFEATMRGQNTLDSTLNLDPAVGIYVDGVYIGPDIGNAVALNFDDAASVEVLKGPQGTLYGRNTSAGAIKLDHQLPGYTLSGWVEGDLGNYDLHAIKGAVTVPLIDQKLSVRLYGRYSAHNGWGQNTTQGVPVNDDNNYSFAGTVQFDPLPGLRMVTRVSYDHDKSGGPSVEPVAILATTNLETLAIAAQNNLGFPGAEGLSPAQIQQAVNLFNTLGPRPGSYDMTSRFPTTNVLTLTDISNIITYEVSPSLTIKSVTGYRHINTYRGIDFSGTYAVSDIAVAEPLNYNQFSEELTASGSMLSSKLKYTVGLFYLKAKGEDRSDATTAPILGQVYGAASPIPTGDNLEDGIEHTTSYAAYGQASYEILSGLNITGGVRYTKEKKNVTSFNQFIAGTYNNANGFVNLYPAILNVTDFCSQPNQGTGYNCSGYYPYSFSKVNWLASVDYKINPSTLVYGKVTTGFRSGGVQLRLGGGPSFNPETVIDYEIGLKADFFNHRARLNIDGYLDNYSGLQKTVLSVVNNALNSVVANAAKARIKGVEFDAQVEPINGLTFGWNGAYTDPKYLSYINNGQDWSHHKFQAVSKFVWTLSADYRMPTSFGKIAVNLNYWHTSSIPLQPDAGVHEDGSNPWDTQKAFGLLNGRVEATIHDRVTIGIWGKNLTNKYYYTYGLDLTKSLGYALAWGGAPRTFGADVKYKF